MEHIQTYMYFFSTLTKFIVSSCHKISNLIQYCLTLKTQKEQFTSSWQPHGYIIIIKFLIAVYKMSLGQQLTHEFWQIKHYKIKSSSEDLHVNYIPLFHIQGHHSLYQINSLLNRNMNIRIKPLHWITGCSSFQVTRIALVSGPKIPVHFQQAIYSAIQSDTHHIEHWNWHRHSVL